MSLATSKDNTPWVCEVHFAYDDRLNLYFVSKPTTRHCQEIAMNANVSGNIIKTHELGEQVVGVYFEGAAMRLSAGKELDAAFECVKERLRAKDDSYEVAKDPQGSHQIYKIVVKNWYVFGRFGEPSGKKHMLVWNGGL